MSIRPDTEHGHHLAAGLFQRPDRFAARQAQPDLRRTAPGDSYGSSPYFALNERRRPSSLQNGPPGAPESDVDDTGARPIQQHTRAELGHEWFLDPDGLFHPSAIDSIGKQPLQVGHTATAPDQSVEIPSIVHQGDAQRLDRPGCSTRVTTVKPGRAVVERTSPGTFEMTMLNGGGTADKKTRQHRQRQRRHIQCRQCKHLQLRQFESTFLLPSMDALMV